MNIISGVAGVVTGAFLAPGAATVGELVAKAGYKKYVGRELTREEESHCRVFSTVASQAAVIGLIGVGPFATGVKIAAVVTGDILGALAGVLLKGKNVFGLIKDTSQISILKEGYALRRDNIAAPLAAIGTSLVASTLFGAPALVALGLGYAAGAAVGHEMQSAS